MTRELSSCILDSHCLDDLAHPAYRGLHRRGELARRARDHLDARIEASLLHVRARDRVPPSSRPTSAVPRLSPRSTPEALPYPILRRLSSPSESCAAPCSAWLEATPAGRPPRAGGERGAAGRGALARGRRKKCFRLPIREGMSFG